MRTSDGKSNRYRGVRTPSAGRIVARNVFSLFHLLIAALAVVVFLAGSPRNALFLGVIVSNAAIGIYQELRAKHATDKLNLLADQHVTVRRDGKDLKIEPGEIVLGDLLLCHAGDQIPVDARIVRGEAEVNEAFLTGESEPVEKAQGDRLLSGSFLTAGRCAAEVTAVNADAYAARITDRAKKIKRPTSEIRRSLNWILRIGMAVIPFLGGGLYLKQILAGRHGLTREGVVVHQPGKRPLKSKLLEDYDVLVHDIFPADTKSEPRAGGFGYALPDQPDKVVGRVGTGFDHQLLKDMLANPQDYIGRTARIRSQGQYDTGAFRAPSFIAMKED